MTVTNWDYKSVSKGNLIRIFIGIDNDAIIDWEFLTLPSDLSTTATGMGNPLGDHMNQLMDRTDSCTPNNPGVFVAGQLLRKKLAILILMVLVSEAVLKIIIYNASPRILKQVTAVKPNPTRQGFFAC